MSVAAAHPPHGAGVVCTDDAHCVTCADAADPMLVLSTDAQAGVAVCDDGRGGRCDVMVDLVAPVSAGETLLVHAGVAIARVGGTA